MKQVWCKQLLEEKNITLAFVYSCRSEENLSLNLAASNEYQIFCNGNFLAYGPMRSAHGYSHVRQYPLSPDKAGKITVTVLVCGAQVNSYDRVNETPFFSAEILRGEEVLAESNDFKAYRVTDRVQKVQRYSFQRTFAESYRTSSDRTALLSGQLCKFPQVEVSEVQGNQLLKGNCLSEPDYHFVGGTPIEYGAAVIDPDRKTYRDRSLTGIGCVKEYMRFSEEELEEILTDEAGKIVCRPDGVCKGLSGGRYVSYDLGKNLSGFFRFEIAVRKKATVYLLFDEIVTPTKEEGLYIDICRLQCCNVIKYVLEEGKYTLQSFAPYTARYARVAVMQGEVEIHGLGMVTYENPDVKLQFVCEDEQLTSVVEAACASFRQNAVDVLTDCPSRERAGWLCDSYFTARAEKFLTGENRVEKNFLQCLLLAPELPFEKGMLPMCYPADHIDGVNIPNWSMWFILELRDYLARTGDRETVDAFKEKVYGIICFLDGYRNEYDLLENLQNWVFIEWSKANEFIQGVNFPSNMLYALALECAAELYKDENLLGRSKKLKETIRALSFNGEFFVDQALRDGNKLVLTENITETCQYYAFWTGVAEKERYAPLYKTMLKNFAECNPTKNFSYVHPSNAFVGKLLRMDYFLREGEYDAVLEEAKTYYLPMAQRTGTLWEHLNTAASCNHGFSSYIAYLLISAYSKRKGAV